jgi:hypothetical protein
VRPYSALRVTRGNCKRQKTIRSPFVGNLICQHSATGAYSRLSGSMRLHGAILPPRAVGQTFNAWRFLSALKSSACKHVLELPCQVCFSVPSMQRPFVDRTCLASDYPRVISKRGIISNLESLKTRHKPNSVQGMLCSGFPFRGRGWPIKNPAALIGGGRMKFNPEQAKWGLAPKYGSQRMAALRNELALRARDSFTSLARGDIWLATASTSASGASQISHRVVQFQPSESRAVIEH